MKLVIVTGLSGSGKSTALHTLEDVGYYCIDNLPVFLLPAFGKELAQSTHELYQLTAVGIDARNQPSELGQAHEVITTMRMQGIECEILFLEAQDEVLIRRFSETRRKHPLSNQDRPLADAIKLERELLAPLLSAADLRIDTTHSNVHELRALVRQRLSHASASRISLLFQSFGYKHGVPRDADFVYDARCLPNPHWQADLRPLTGRDQAVADFLEQDERVSRMKEQISAFLEQWIPCFEQEGRSYLTIAIGCTGGQHRSVYLVEQLSDHFKARGCRALTRHRELP